jgi:hypothetical protein
MLLYLLFKLGCLGVCMAFLTPMKFSGRKPAVYVFCFQSVIYLANCAIYLLAGEDVYKSFSFVSIAVPGFFCFNCLTRRKGFSVLFTPAPGPAGR